MTDASQSSDFPWEALIAYFMGMRGMAAYNFWSLSLCELRFILTDNSPHSQPVQPPSHDELTAWIEKEYPHDHPYQ